MQFLYIRLVFVIVGIFYLTSATEVFSQNLRAGVNQLAEKIIEASPNDRQLRVAIADFPDLEDVISNLGRFIANKMTTRLAQSQKFSVIERHRLGQVLSELKLSMTDLFDPKKVKKLGEMVGVEALVVGTISDLGAEVDLDARIIEIETNQTILGETVTISKDERVKELLEQGRREIRSAPSFATHSASSSSAAPTARHYQSPELKNYIKGIKLSAANLNKRSEKGAQYKEIARGYISEYNRLVDEIKPVLKDEVYIQALQHLKPYGNTNQESWSVATASKGLETYLSSFSAKDAFRASAQSLFNYASKGAQYAEIAKGYIGEYNKIIEELKIVFKTNILVNSLQKLEYTGNVDHTASAVANAAQQIQVAMGEEIKK